MAHKILRTKGSAAFIDRLLKLVPQYRKDVGHQAEVVATRLFARIVSNTPYDTGNAQHSWDIEASPGVDMDNKIMDIQVAIDTDYSAYDAQRGTKADRQTSKMSFSAGLQKASHVRGQGIDGPMRVNIRSEGAPYVERLERGSSDQAPRGYIRLAVKDAGAELSRKLKRIL